MCVCVALLALAGCSYMSRVFFEPISADDAAANTPQFYHHHSGEHAYMPPPSPDHPHNKEAPLTVKGAQMVGVP